VILVSSEDQNVLQRDTLAAIQQLMAHSPSRAALQLQLAQQGQHRPDAMPGGEKDLPVIGEQYLVFTLADREIAVKAEQVQGVERLIDATSVPHTAPWVKGVMNLRGSIVSVVDLRMFLGLEVLPSTPRTRLLSLQWNDMVICLTVDGVSEMMPIPAPAIINGNVRQATIPPWAIPFATGSALIANRVLVVLDVARLLFSEKMQHYSIRAYDN
jgi:purine-binding chemotaxis protein CheW